MLAATCIVVAVLGLDREYVIDCSSKPVVPKLLLDYIIETKTGDTHIPAGGGFIMAENTSAKQLVDILELMVRKDIKGDYELLPGDRLLLKSVGGQPLKRVVFPNAGWKPEVTIRLKPPVPPKKK